MRLVIADTSPLNYLVLIEQIELLPTLFKRVLAPPSVLAELQHPDAPAPVRQWAASPPEWVEFFATSGSNTDPRLSRLDVGERDAILLALELKADLLLIDERAGASAARDLGFAVTGTLGILDLAADRALIDLTSAVAHLKNTSFRCRPAVFAALLARHGLR